LKPCSSMILAPAFKILFLVSDFMALNWFTVTLRSPWSGPAHPNRSHHPAVGEGQFTRSYKARRSGLMAAKCFRASSGETAFKVPSSNWITTPDSVTIL